MFEIPWLDLYLLQVLLMHAFITRLLALDTTSCTLWEVAGIATLGFIPIRILALSLLLAYEAHLRLFADFVGICFSCFALGTRPCFEPVLGADNSLSAIFVLKPRTSYAAATWIPMFHAVVRIVDACVVLYSVQWSSLRLCRVA